MNEATGSTEVGAEGAAAKEKTLANIVRGTLPLPLVYAIRFDEKDAKDADVAKKYGTTTGKVADIRKGRNFGYIDETYAPTQEQKDAALTWLKQVPSYDQVGTDAAVVLVESMKVATDADNEALKAKRASIREKNAGASADGQAAPKAKSGGKKAPKAANGNGGAPASKDDAASLMS